MLLIYFYSFFFVIVFRPSFDVIYPWLEGFHAHLDVGGSAATPTVSDITITGTVPLFTSVHLQTDLQRLAPSSDSTSNITFCSSPLTGTPNSPSFKVRRYGVISPSTPTSPPLVIPQSPPPPPLPLTRPPSRVDYTDIGEQLLEIDRL